MADLAALRELFDDMPEQAVIVRGITVVMYLDSEGHVSTLWRLHEDGMLVEWVGLLEFTKQQIIFNAFAEDMEGDG